VSQVGPVSFVSPVSLVCPVSQVGSVSFVSPVSLMCPVSLIDSEEPGYSSLGLLNSEAAALRQVHLQSYLLASVEKSH